MVIAQDWTIVVMVKMRGTLSSRLKDTNTDLRLADEILSSLTFTMQCPPVFHFDTRGGSLVKVSEQSWL